VLNEASRSGFKVVAMSSHARSDGGTEYLWTLQFTPGTENF
jgi:hypothetical protein